MKNFYAFSHIPKTAGTSFNEILLRNFRASRYLNPAHGLYEGPIGKENAKLYFEDSNDSKILAGHRVSLNLPFEDLVNGSLTCFTIIRNPLRRLRSEYFYLKSLKRKIRDPYIEESNCYQEYLEKIINNDKLIMEIGTYQFQFLLQNCENKNFVHLENLVDDNYFFPMVQEKFIDCMVLLEKFFPVDFKNCSYTIQNVTSHYNLTKQEIELEKKVKDKIIKIPNNDLMLWNFANNFIAEKSAYDYFERELHRMKTRNKLRRMIHSPFLIYSRRFSNLIERI